MPVYKTVSEACCANGAGVVEQPKLNKLEQASYEQIRDAIYDFQFGRKTWHQVKMAIKDAIETEEFEPWQPGQ